MSISEPPDIFRGSGFWSKRSKLQKSAILVAFIFLIAAVIALCCIFLIKQASVCETSVCRDEASKLLLNIRSKVDPCQDFYEFACGGYEANHELPPDKGRLSTFDSVADNVLDRLKLIYAAPADEQRVKPLKFISHFYQTCNRSVDNVDSLHQMLQHMGGWPIAGIRGTVDKTEYDWESALLVVLSEFGENVVVAAGVAPNPYNTSTYALTIDQPSLGVGRAELMSQTNDSESEDLVNAYKSYIQNTVLLLSPGREDIKRAAAEILAFETSLAEISAAPEDRRDHWEKTKKETLGNLRIKIGSKIPELLRKVYQKIDPSEILDDEKDFVIVNDMEFFEKLEDVLLRTKKDVILNYIGWRMLQIVGFLSGPSFRANELKFKRVQTGIEKLEGMDRRCLDLLSDMTPDLVGRTYIDNFVLESDKEIANRMIHHVLDRFKDIVSQKEWMDDKTRRNSIHKAEGMDINTGYPDWLNNSQALESEFDFGTYGNRTTIDALLHMFQVLTAKEYRKLRKGVDRSREWPMGAATVNAAYDPTQNSMTIPSAILQDVFFNASRPMYLNYGAMGAVIGHEITHGFDDEGAQFDHDGNLLKWWSEDTLQHFQNLSQCFIDQYSAINDTRVGLMLNGRNTLGENIADNGGIREAFEAYVKLDARESSLPGLSMYTNEQLFFISYANTWCSITRNEKLRQSILYDPHSPAKYRVNIPLANYEVFAKVWNCPTSSPMSAQQHNKCVVW